MSTIVSRLSSLAYLQVMHKFLLITLVAAACGTPPEPIPSYAVDSLGDTVIVPVRHISDAVPRSDGSWVVLGVEEFKVMVANFSTDTAVPFPGMSVEEAPNPTVIFGAGDTTLVGDWGLRRVTSWLPNGTRVDAVPTPDQLKGVFPEARDAAGQWYFELNAPLGRDGRGILDSGAVVRADPYLTKFDTLARVTPPESKEVFRNGIARPEPLAMAGRDKWGVLPDGTLWIARVQQNKLDWYPASGAEPIHGKPLPDWIVPIDATDRELFASRFPEDQRANLTQINFALVKPAFERAFADEQGRIWLFKSAPALDSVRTFQVADSTGWLFNVTVPSYGIALGINRDVVVMGEEFPGGIRMLRFKRPTESKIKN